MTSWQLLPPNPGEDGWDIFALSYHVDVPINAVINDSCIGKYLNVFHFLWKLKRVQFSLSATWSRHMTAAHHLIEAQPQLGSVLHRCHLLRHDMLHLASTLSNYMMFEVLETSWEGLVKDAHAAKDLDGIIAAHDKFLTNVMERGLLTGTTAVLQEPLANIFDDILHFVRVQEQLYTAAQTEVSAARRRKATAEGEWLDEGAEAEAEMHMLEIAERALGEVTEIQESFTEAMQRILEMLRSQDSPSEEFRFLIVRLDFNEFYERERLSHEADTGYGDSDLLATP